MLGRVLRAPPQRARRTISSLGHTALAHRNCIKLRSYHMLRTFNTVARRARPQLALQSICNSSTRTSRIALLKPRPALAQQLSRDTSTNARSTVPPLVDTALLSRSTVPPYVDTALFSHAEPDKHVLLHRDFTSTRAQLTRPSTRHRTYTTETLPHAHWSPNSPRYKPPTTPGARQTTSGRTTNSVRSRRRRTSP